MSTTIPASVLEELTRQIELVCTDSKERIRKVLESIDWSAGDISSNRAVVSEAVQMLLADRTEVSAQAAADFYDVAREMVVGKPMGAAAISGWDPGESDQAVRAAVELILEGKGEDAFDETVSEHVDAMVRRSANVCVAENATADPKETRWAWVPAGGETCGFCLMLASRGFEVRKASQAKHAHPNCRCRLVPQWGDESYEGYDPDECEDMWKNPDDHPDLQDARKARRRELYAQKKEAAGETVTPRGANKSPTKRTVTTAAKPEPSRPALSSFGDMSDYIGGATSMEDLKDRCDYIDSVWKKANLPDAYRKQLGKTVRSMKSKLK